MLYAQAQRMFGVGRQIMKRLFLAALVLLLARGFTPAAAQERKGTISGHVMDPNQDPLVGARVELQPSGQSVVSDAQGQFKISDLAPGKYTLTVSYVGFKPFSKDVTVTSGAAVDADAALELMTVNQSIIVRGVPSRGEVETP